MSEANRRVEVRVEDENGLVQLRFQMLDDWKMTTELIKPRTEYQGALKEAEEPPVVDTEEDDPWGEKL